MGRPEDQTLGRIDDTSARLVGIRLNTASVRRDLRVLLSLIEKELDDTGLALLQDVGQRLHAIDDLTWPVQQEVLTFRRAYRRNRHRWRLEGVAKRRRP